MPVVVDEVEVVPAGQAQPAAGQGGQGGAASSKSEVKPGELRRVLEILRARSLRVKAG